VASRRLGLSLGVDIGAGEGLQPRLHLLPGSRTTKKTVKRRICANKEGFGWAEWKIASLRSQWHETEGTSAKKESFAIYITISGSGEPTLNSKIGVFIDRIKKTTDIPVAIMTNEHYYIWRMWGGLREGGCGAAVAGCGWWRDVRENQQAGPQYQIEKVVEGLVKFRKSIRGRFGWGFYCWKGQYEQEGVGGHKKRQSRQ